MGRQASGQTYQGVRRQVANFGDELEGVTEVDGALVGDRNNNFSAVLLIKWGQTLLHRDEAMKRADPRYSAVIHHVHGVDGVLHGAPVQQVDVEELDEAAGGVVVHLLPGELEADRRVHQRLGDVSDDEELGLHGLESVAQHRLHLQVELHGGQAVREHLEQPVDVDDAGVGVAPRKLEEGVHVLADAAREAGVVGEEGRHHGVDLGAAAAVQLGVEVEGGDVGELREVEGELVVHAEAHGAAVGGAVAAERVEEVGAGARGDLDGEADVRQAVRAEDLLVVEQHARRGGDVALHEAAEEDLEVDAIDERAVDAVGGGDGERAVGGESADVRAGVVIAAVGGRVGTPTVYSVAVHLLLGSGAGGGVNLHVALAARDLHDVKHKRADGGAEDDAAHLNAEGKVHVEVHEDLQAGVDDVLVEGGAPEHVLDLVAFAEEHRADGVLAGREARDQLRSVRVDVKVGVGEGVHGEERLQQNERVLPRDGGGRRLTGIGARVPAEPGDNGVLVDHERKAGRALHCDGHFDGLAEKQIQSHHHLGQDAPPRSLLKVPGVRAGGGARGGAALQGLGDDAGGAAPEKVVGVQRYGVDQALAEVRVDEKGVPQLEGGKERVAQRLGGLQQGLVPAAGGEGVHELDEEVLRYGLQVAHALLRAHAVALDGGGGVEVPEVVVVAQQQGGELAGRVVVVGAAHQDEAQVHEVVDGPLVEVHGVVPEVAVGLELLVLDRLVQVQGHGVVQEVAAEGEAHAHDLQGDVERDAGVGLAGVVHGGGDDVRPGLDQHLRALLEVAQELVEVGELEAGHGRVDLRGLVHGGAGGGFDLGQGLGQQVDAPLVVGHADVKGELLQLGDLGGNFHFAAGHANGGDLVGVHVLEAADRLLRVLGALAQ
ncbi:uncharacterized protein BcabD6B2_06590 [Babesia caballi]|uniref:Uncharacterized protein n=1 Tax=Babesia caballi TaxID=5871 RepID=A0AAV4LMM1_BABCB|nr:hypothetical protein, conserved [Babesia caballi]